jgi:hypothetical protein
MRQLLTVLSLTAALAFAACGDDEEEPATTGATGATGIEGAASGGIATAGEYLEASLPDEVEAIEDTASGESACEGVDFEKGNFQVGVAISAAQVDPETPFPELVATECEEE